MKSIKIIVLALFLIALFLTMPLSSTATDTKVFGCRQAFEGPLFEREIWICYEAYVSADTPLDAQPGEKTTWTITLHDGTATLCHYRPILKNWSNHTIPMGYGDKEIAITIPGTGLTFNGLFAPSVSAYLTVSGPGSLSKSSLAWEDEGTEEFTVTVNSDAIETQYVTVNGEFTYTGERSLDGPLGWTQVSGEKNVLLGSVELGTMGIIAPTFIGDTPPVPTDSDGDGWTDEHERRAGTNPYNVDTDGDGTWDPQDPNPLAAPTVTSTPTPMPATTDSDGDGWTDEHERRAGTNPYNVDTDGDGMWDTQDPNPLVKQTPAPVAQQPLIPGFEVITAITGLILVVYILRSRK